MKDSYDLLIGGDFAPDCRVEPFNPFGPRLSRLVNLSVYTIINLESPLTDRGKAISKTGRSFRTSPHYAKILKQAGVDCVCLANNHIRDYGDQGVTDTISYCRDAGLDVVGAGRSRSEASLPLIKKIGTQQVAFLNYCEKEFSIADDCQAGANRFDLIDACHDLSNLRGRVDRIIVIYHGGLEYHHYPTLEMRKALLFLLEYGADAIVTHHTHAYSGMEILQGKPVCYGLGNLFFPAKGKTNTSWLTGTIAGLTIEYERVECALLVTGMDNDMQGVDLLSHGNYDKVMDHLAKLSGDIANGTLEKYWSGMYNSMKYDVVTGFAATSKTTLKLRKRLGLKIKRLSKYRTNIWLNSLRCSSHREKMISVLELIQREQER